ncbi:sodium-dependent transporter [Thioalkalivibrio sp. HL-Eb18]|uniref:sodium-dependent transporter n=1 Tax=Thioalkalivibrio sp. HL-Eb18 TaxID=1266913 RepID=UPI0003666C42|nr:sodium-dependent transporter [Thioalkalivibrio sp. HL-Eb18]
MEPAATEQRWGHRYAFLLAATASAVGLGNIWKFPYVLGENGGGAFLLVYLAAIAAIGVPVMMAEVMIGRRGRHSPGYAARRVARETGAREAWQVVGWLGLASAFLIMSFYVVIAGWSLAYIGKAASGQFAGADAEQVGAIFASMTANPGEMILWTSVAVIGAFVIVGFGLRRGLERGVRILMPLLLLLLVVTTLISLAVGDPSTAFAFMFRPDFSALDMGAVLIAIGQAFFTLTLAAGVLMMFGAYLPSDSSIARTAVGVALADTLIAIIAGIAIFPVVFGFGLDPAEGPGLMFQTLPLSLSAVPAGVVLATLFFVMLSVAGFSTMITNVQAFVHLLEERLHLNRWVAASGCGAAIWLLSLATVFSFTGAGWAQLEWSILGREVTTVFELVEHLSINVLLPLGGLLIAVFVGWVIKPDISREEIATGPVAYHVWRLFLRYVAPLAIALVFLQLTGLLPGA